MTSATSYHEYRFDGDQKVELLEDRVLLKGKRTFGPEYECTAMLETLDPIPNRVVVRPKGFWQGIFFAVFALLATRMPFFGLESGYWGFPWVLAGAFLLLSVVTAKKIEWAQFKTKSGAVAFNIAKAGRGGGDFDRFVESLSRRIAESADAAR